MRAAQVLGKESKAAGYILLPDIRYRKNRKNLKSS